MTLSWHSSTESGLLQVFLAARHQATQKEDVHVIPRPLHPAGSAARSRLRGAQQTTIVLPVSPMVILTVRLTPLPMSQTQQMTGLEALPTTTH